MAYLRRKGARTIYLDGAPRAVSLYQRAGLVKVCRSLRLVGELNGAPDPQVRPMQSQDLPEVKELDGRAFGADRGFFLERRLAMYPELCKVMEKEGEMQGFILGRRGNGLVSAGPWIARQGVEHPEALLLSLAREARGDPVAIGVLEANQGVVELIRSLGLEERPNPPWRMALGDKSELGMSPMALAVGSAAKG